MANSSALPYRFSPHPPRNKPAQMLKNFTLNGLGLGLKGTNVNNHTIDTEAGPWNWQWREDTLESLPTDASRFVDVASQIEPKSELDFVPVLSLLKATDQIHASLDRVNALETCMNTNAREGYKRNYAAAVGRWEVLFKSISTKSTEHPKTISDQKLIYTTVEGSPVNASSTFSRISSKSREGDVSSDFEEGGCPDLTRASPWSSFSSLGNIPSPKLSLVQPSAGLENFITKSENIDMWGIRCLETDNVLPKKKTASYADVVRENDENRPPSRAFKYDRPDPLLIPKPSLRGKRAHFGTLYDTRLKSPKISSIDQFDMGRVGITSPFTSLSLSSIELARLERLHEQAKCIDDWSWAFGDEVDQAADEMESGEQILV